MAHTPGEFLGNRGEQQEENRLRELGINFLGGRDSRDDEMVDMVIFFFEGLFRGCSRKLELCKFLVNAEGKIVALMKGGQERIGR